MKTAGQTLLIVSMLAGAHPVLAKAPAPSAVTATPLGSPGDWIGSGDYPAAALRLDMTGVTVFRLTVDATGKPSRCDIVGSSGFDVLDRTTCERLMAKARFSPSRDRRGKPVAATYSSRVRWVLPPDASHPVTERFASLLLSIDQTGKPTSCRLVQHVPAEAAAPSADACDQAIKTLPPAFGLEMRGGSASPSAEVELRIADVFTPALQARVLSPRPGYEQRALNIHRFAVARDGKLAQCSYEEQRGSDLLAADFCLPASRERFDPPFGAFDKDGVAHGWHIVRVLLKTDQ